MAINPLMPAPSHQHVPLQIPVSSSCLIALGILVALGGVFMALAAYKVLPSYVNGLSRLNETGESVSVTVAILGIVVTVAGGIFWATQKRADNKIPQASVVASTCRDRIAARLLGIASLATEPVIAFREARVDIYDVPGNLPQHPPASLKTLRKVAHVVLGVLGLLTLAPVAGMGLRALAGRITPQNFVLYRSPCPSPYERSLRGRISSIFLNLCGVVGGYNKTDGGVPHWRERLGNIIGVIQSQPDVCMLGLAEVFDYDCGYEIKKCLAYLGYSYFVDNAGACALVGAGTFFASKHPIVDTDFVPFVGNTGRSSGANKGSLLVTVRDKQDHLFQVGVQHWTHSEIVNHPTEAEKAARLTQAKQTLAQMQRKQRVNTPILQMGDLNCDCTELCAMDLGKGQSTQDLFHVAETGSTWGGDAWSALYSRKQASFGQVLDFGLLYKDGICPDASIKVTVLDSYFDATKAPCDQDPRIVSDHYPLLIEVIV